MKETSRRRLVEVPDGVWDDLKAWAGSQGRPMCDVVSGALQAFLEGVEGVEGGGDANGGGVAGRAEGEPEGAEVAEHRGRSKKGRTPRVGKSSRGTGRRVLSTRSTNRVREDTGKPSSVKGVKRGQGQQSQVGSPSKKSVHAKDVLNDHMVSSPEIQSSVGVVVSADCQRCGHAKIRHVFGSTKTRCDCLTCPVFVEPEAVVVVDGRAYRPGEEIHQSETDTWRAPYLGIDRGVSREQVEEATHAGVQGTNGKGTGYSASLDRAASGPTVSDVPKVDRDLVDDGLDF